ncbi:hypothetical protein DFP72DRAFT_1174277 [Ephemerocybe angulata]|uniref:F-box domain-containing protein n=1 Tax=Ephemerocybe angulata TaxID=980116 RepID=A0A8H6LZ75_9AGAR|nr:hypothetical protein DFP72DRAFT_1174277 [Tulosesus angulatus]
MPSDSIPSQGLPAEIWMRIFRLAAHAFDPADTGVLASMLPSCLARNVQEESLSTKHALALVCHQWNAAATTILYEHITFLTRPTVRITKLLNTMTDPESGGGPSHLACLVKCIDIPSLIRGERIDLAVQLCKRMTNLVAFFGMLENGVDPLLLLNVLPSCLVHLHIQGQGTRAAEPPISLGDLNDFLVGHPNLVTLSIPSELTREYIGWQAGRSWPSIRKLTMQCSDQASALARHVPTGAFPNLEVVIFQDGGTPRCDSAIGSFLSIHGGPLVSVGLTQLGTSQAYPMNISLQHVDQKCPNVKEIIVSFIVYPSGSLTGVTGFGLTWITNTVAMSRRMPQIVSVGVQLRLLGHVEDRIHCLHHAVAMPWTKLFPELQRIRVLADVDFDEYRAHDEATFADLYSTGRFAKHPIRVEDITGKFLGEFSKGMCFWV